MNYRYSAIADYYKCPRYYQLRHILQIQPVVTPSSALKFGTAIHAGVESYFKQENGVDTFEAFWEAERGKDLVYYGGETWDSLLADGKVLLNKFDKYHLRHLEPAYIEQKLSGTLGPIKLEGTVDFAGKYKGINSIVDFKTSGKPYNVDKLITNEQMFIYGHMLEQKQGFKAEQHIYIVFKKSRWSQDAGIQVLARPVNTISKTSSLNNVKEVAQQMSDTTCFTMNKNSCSMGTYRCDFWDHCYKEDK